MKNVNKEEFLENREKQYAVLRALEIIGEATKNLSKEMKAEHPEVNWSDIAGMRDRLIHDYMGVNYSIVWDVLKNKIPELYDQIIEVIEND